MKNSYYKLSDFFLLESNKKILDFRCSQTNLIIWPIIRTEIFNLIISKLYYDDKFIIYNKKNNFFLKLALLHKSLKIIFFFKNLFLKLEKKNLLYVKSGISNIEINKKIFDKNIDYFISLNKNNYITFSRSNKFSFLRKYFDNKIYYLNFNENIINLVGRSGKKNLKVAKKISYYLKKKIYKIFKISLNNIETQRLIGRNLYAINSIQKKLAFYKKLIKKIQPKLAIIECASYSNNALLNYALHSHGIRVAEPQHGIISKGHENYNFSSFIKNNKEYKLFLPDDFLAYGNYWIKEISTSCINYKIGHPHRTQNLIKKNYKKKLNKNKNIKILLVSDGIETEKLINLAKNLYKVLEKNYEIIIRPHPIENINLYKKKIFLKKIKIDNEANVYKSMLDKDIVVSEMSTVLYESLNIVPKIFILRTKKSLFALPDHPFKEVRNINELIKNIRSVKNINSKIKINDYFCKDWKKNFKKYLKKFI